MKEEEEALKLYYKYCWEESFLGNYVCKFDEWTKIGCPAPKYGLEQMNKLDREVFIRNNRG